MIIINRDIAIDRFRGLAIFLMVLVNGIANISGIPPFLKHADDIGLTLADIVAPMFIFATGITYRSSFYKKLERSVKSAYIETTRRYLALAGMGAIFSAGENKVWGVLEAIGFAGLITMAVIRLKPWLRFAVGVGMLGIYQIILDKFMLEAVLSSSHGGLFAAVSWGAMMIISTAISESYKNSKKQLDLMAAILIVLSTISGVIFGISKNRVSAAYVLFSILISLFLFILVDLITKKLLKKPDLLSMWGENPISMYFLHLVLLGIMGLVLGFENVPMLPGLLCVALILTFLSIIAVIMSRKKIYLSL